MGKLTVIQHINRLQPRQRFSPKCATCATYTRQGHFYMLTCTFDHPCLCRRGVSPYLDPLLCTTFCDCDWGSLNNSWPCDFLETLPALRVANGPGRSLVYGQWVSGSPLYHS
jgi:hypothetical protein